MFHGRKIEEQIAPRRIKFNYNVGQINVNVCQFPENQLSEYANISAFLRYAATINN